MASGYTEQISQTAIAAPSHNCRRAMVSAFAYRLCTADDIPSALALFGLVHDAARFAVRRTRALIEEGDR